MDISHFLPPIFWRGSIEGVLSPQCFFVQGGMVSDQEYSFALQEEVFETGEAKASHLLWKRHPFFTHFGIVLGGFIEDRVFPNRNQFFHLQRRFSCL